MLYGAAHPYGRRPRGTVESVETIDAAALRRFHAERFRPAALSLVMVGDIEPGARSTRPARAFGDVERRRRLPPRVCARCRPRLARRVRVIPMMNKAQADIAYGFTSLRRSDPGVLRLLADEQHPRPVLDRRPARRQHPRAAGHGVLRVQRARRERHPRPADDPRRRQSRQRRSRGRVDRRGAADVCAARGRPSRRWPSRGST